MHWGRGNYFSQSPASRKLKTPPPSGTGSNPSPPKFEALLSNDSQSRSQDYKYWSASFKQSPKKVGKAALLRCEAPPPDIRSPAPLEFDASSRPQDLQPHSSEAHTPRTGSDLVSPAVANPGHAPRSGTFHAPPEQHGRPPEEGAVLEPGPALRLARPAHLRCVRQEPGGPSPRGQGGQAGELRGGARAALHRPPEGLAVAAHREPAQGRPCCRADGGGRLPSEAHVRHLPRLPGRLAGPEVWDQASGHFGGGPAAAACMSSTSLWAMARLCCPTFTSVLCSSTSRLCPRRL